MKVSPYKKRLALLFFFAHNLLLFGQHKCVHPHSEKEDIVERPKVPMRFIENKNQWHNDLRFQSSLGGFDKVFLENDALRYCFYDAAETKLYQEALHHKDFAPVQQTVHGHAYRVRFLNANEVTPSGDQQQTTYNNYFLGNDPEKWASNVPVFHQVKYNDLYDGIQLVAYSQEGLFKYDFVIDPGADPSQIALAYEGVDDLFIKNGQLHIQTSVTIVNEYEPYAYQIINGKKRPLLCAYQLDGNVVRFHFPEGYNNTLPLVIDPTVVAATFTGTASAVTFGHTATYDNSGNIYAAGSCFDPGYDTSVGAFQTDFAGGSTDSSISKFSPDGSSQIYATYLGGGGSDYPHSMIVDQNGQLCVYGSSSSYNFPVTANAIQTTYGGSTDIVITKFNADGSALIGSTYLGGSDSDGVNQSFNNNNYGDSYRGEIMLDEQGNIYIASSSNSQDFPVTPNAFQQNANNTQSAVVAKCNSDLSTLFWATYLSSSENDIGFGLKIGDLGGVYVTGVAGADDFPVTAGSYQDSWPGGEENGFIAQLSADGQQLLNGSFFGSSDGAEHSFFIDIDEDSNVHIYGQTDGTIDITPNTYFFNEGSQQFVAALNSDLSTKIYSTVIGTGPSSFNFSPDFVPVAFMVDKCNGIYLSGYNAYTNDLPVTADALYENDFGAFYLVKLTPNAEALDFATFYPAADHVDGGTSRFDKAGIVYQAVCSGFGSSMYTTSNAYAPSQTASWDIGVFKIDFEIATVTAAAFAAPSTSGCAPFSVDFTYTGQDAETYFWDFGTGDTSTEENPSYTFENAGSYTIMQVVNAFATCNQTDTFYLQIDVLNNSSTRVDTTICGGSSDLFLDATTVNATYQWQDGTTGATYQTADVGTYWVDITIAGCTRRDSFVVSSATPFSFSLEDDLSFCDVASYTIDATQPWAQSYVWTNGNNSPTLTVGTSGTYAVVLLDSLGCSTSDEINITFTQSPVLDIGPDTTLCEGTDLLINASIPNATYQWQDGSVDPNYLANNEGIYAVTVTVGACTVEDQLQLNYTAPLPLQLLEDQLFCDVENFTIDATTAGAITYDWSTGASSPSILVSNSGTYSVTISDGSCETVDEVALDFEISPIVALGADTILCIGEQTTLIVVGNGNIQWQDGSSGNTYLVDSEGWYWVIADNNGCTDSDSLFVTYADNPGVEFSITEADCYGSETGTITSIVAQGGTDLEYQWSTGASTPDLDTLASGTYEVTITNEFDCVFETTVTVEQPDPLVFEFNIKDVQCYGDQDGWVTIDNAIGGVPPYQYSIDGGLSFTENTIYQNLNGGNYEVVITDANGCTTSETAVIYEPEFFILDAGEDKYINLGDRVRIDGELFPITNQEFQWILGDSLECDTCLRPFADPSFSNSYVLLTTDSITGCTLRDTMEIFVKKPRNVYIPNVFSPNGDGVNDYFFPFGDSSVRKVNYFRVYDRWGEQVHGANNFEVNDKTYGWDGYLKGKLLNPGVFAFIAEIEFVDGAVLFYRGDVTLLK